MFRAHFLQAPAEGEAAPAPGAAAPAVVVPPADGATPPVDGKPAAAVEPTNLVADAKTAAPADGKGEEKKPEVPPVEPTKEDRTKYLTDKGLKAEDVAKLDDAALKSKFDELKAADARGERLAKIEIKAPEGLKLDDKQITAFKEILIDEKISDTERAQKLVDMNAAALKQAVEAPVELWMRTQTEWQGKVKADPELGGANFPQTQQFLSAALDQIAGAKGTDARKAVDEAFVFTGAGNNPEIIRFVSRVGKMFTEGKMVNGTAPGSKSGADVLADMFPSASKAA